MKNKLLLQKEISIDIESTILDALKQMDVIGKKLLIVTKENKFFSLVSIGDLQRAIIKNLPMDLKIINVLRKDVIIANQEEDYISIKNKMLESRTEFMPIIDSENNIMQILLWEDVFTTKKRTNGPLLNLPVVIMAGGKGIRLKPLTNILPKPLIPIGDKTIIELIMDRFCEVGCNTFYLSVNYKAEMIKYYFSTMNNHNDYKIQYLEEKIPLGTAGSLHLLKGIINTTFFVSNCDILVDQNIEEILDYHHKNNNEITLVAAIKNYSLPYGILETSENGLLQCLTEKPDITFKINTGFYILEPHLINEIPDREFYHITFLIKKLQSERRKVGVFPVNESSWIDIGDWDNYSKTHLNKNKY